MRSSMGRTERPPACTRRKWESRCTCQGVAHGLLTLLALFMRVVCCQLDQLLIQVLSAACVRLGSNDPWC